MLGQRRRRWANIVPALGERLVFAGKYFQPLDVVFRSHLKWMRIIYIYKWYTTIYKLYFNLSTPPFCLFGDANKHNTATRP